MTTSTSTSAPTRRSVVSLGTALRAGAVAGVIAAGHARRHRTDRRDRLPQGDACHLTRQRVMVSAEVMPLQTKGVSLSQ
ncbi:MAG: hypothetical protein QOH68_4189, partial [Nocardioidaceae bacterium]|nr:hypothetical protein [Nocardioidaceae bacterium]